MIIPNWGCQVGLSGPLCPCRYECVLTEAGRVTATASPLPSPEDVAAMTAGVVRDGLEDIWQQTQHLVELLLMMAGELLTSSQSHSDSMVTVPRGGGG